MSSSDKVVIAIQVEKSSRMVGTDELNICEFPLASMGREKEGHDNTLVFEDKIFDDGAKKYVERKLVVTASEVYGLPTPADNDVLLVLMYLTQVRNGFTDREVKFTRYELVKLLGWDQGGKSYRRIDESLQRWVNVTLNYKRAWWNKDDCSWQNQAFHVLESIDLHARRTLNNDALSSFTWNSIIFKSVQSTNVKRLDLEIYLKLKSPAAKQAYRFLDKRFYRSKVLEFTLRSFACEHIGLSRSYDNGQLKHKLRPCLDELEAIGFLVPVSKEERYIKLQRGEWRIRLVRASVNRVRQRIVQGEKDIEYESQGLEKQLTARGVSGVVANDLVASYSVDQILGKVHYFDWLMQNGTNRPKNPGGFLASAIRKDFRPPANYPLTSEPALPKMKQESAPTRSAAMASTTEADDESAKLQAYFKSLQPAEAAAIESQAIETGNRFKVDTYRRLEANRNALWESIRWDLIRTYLQKQRI